MEVVRKYWRKVVQHLKLSNKKDFDDDFYEVLQIYHFFNLYHPQPTLKKQIIGKVTFLLIAVSFFGGFVMAVHDSIEAGDTHSAMFLALVAAMYPAFITQNLNMSDSQPRIIELVKNLQSLHEYEDEAEMDVVRKRGVKMLKWYKIALMSFNLIFVCKPFGINLCNLFVPAIYDKWATSGFFYWILLAVNFVLVHMLLTIFLSSENFHFLCIMRIEANLKILCKKLRHCTDGCKEGNEKELMSLVKYHLAIIEAANELQSIYKIVFAEKLYGLCLQLSFSFFVLLNSSIRDEFIIVTLTFIAALLIFAQFGILCFFGQRVKSLSDDLMDASYECQWYTQSKSFKKSLMIFREASAIPIEFGVLSTSFSHESFYEVMTAVYQSFNNLSSAVSSQT